MQMPKILAGMLGGIAFLLWTCGVLAGSNVSSQTTSDSAQTTSAPPLTVEQPASTSANPEASVEGGSPRIYHVPSAAIAELQQDNAAIEVEKSKALQLEGQLDEAKRVLADQKEKAGALQHQLDLLKEQIDRARPLVDHSDPSSVFAFNSQLEKYNGLLRQVRQEWNSANALLEPFNELVKKVNAQSHLAHQMIDAYNAKLRRIGSVDAEPTTGGADSVGEIHAK